MRRTYLLLLREFKSNLILKIIYIIYVLLSAAVAIFALLEMIIEAPFEAFFGGIQFVLLLSLLHLVFYSLVSYEFCCFDRAVGFDECARAMEIGKSQLILGKIFVLMSLAVPVLIISIAATIVGAIIGHVGAAFFQILVHLILNLAILPTVGILFGAVLACGAKRGLAYIIIAVVTLLSTPLVGAWCVTIYKATGFSASVLTRLFPFMTPSIMLISPDLAYGYSLRPYRIFAYAVWILVLCAVLFFYISKERGKKKRLFSAVVCLVAGMCLLPFVFRSNSDIIYDDMNSEGAGREISYYERNNITSPDACPEFKITSYDMELKLSNVLHAEVKASVSPSNLDIYGFTLYHGYKVKEVKDESGRELKFKQTGDWIEVESAGETSSLTFSYDGYSNTHYSNGQGAALPGTFAYYPRAGYVVCADADGYEHLTLDEPTAGLDPEERLRFQSIISEIKKDKIILISTHIVEDVHAVCETVAVMRDGKIIKSGTREEMAACAEGKTYIIDMDDLPKFKEPYYKQKQFDSDGKYYLRLVSSAPQDFAPVKPNVEDGYICALKGI